MIAEDQILAETYKQSYLTLITEEIASQLKTQIQFYFSDANLISDEKFLKIVNQDKNKWVDVAYILRCSKVKELLSKYNVSYRTQKRIIVYVLKNSTLLKIHHMKIKRKKPFKRNIQNFLYLEVDSEQNVPMILNYVNESIEPKLNFTCKCGKKWLIIVGEDKRREKDEMQCEEKQEKQCKQKTKIKLLEGYLKGRESQFGIKRIESGQKWQGYEKKFTELMQKRKTNKKKAND